MRALQMSVATKILVRDMLEEACHNLATLHLLPNSPEVVPFLALELAAFCIFLFQFDEQNQPACVQACFCDWNRRNF